LHNLSHIGRDEFSNSINTIEDTHT